MLSRFLLLFLLVGFGSGCSHTLKLQEGERPQAWLEPGTKVQLPLPSISPAVRVQQMLTGKFNGKTQSLVVMLEADEQQLTLAGLSALGIRLFLITYDDTGVHVEQSIVLPKAPPAAQILADVMLSRWPLSAWQAQLPKGWRLEDQGDQRSLYNAKGQLISQITYHTEQGLREPIAVNNVEFGYQISIKSLGE